MTRTECYAKIKEYGLQNTIKEVYGYNFTNLSTASLIEAIRDFEIENAEDDDVCICKLDMLIEMLHKKHILCNSEYEELMN